MSRSMTNQFVPNYAVHPGEILEEHLAALGMRQTDQLSLRYKSDDQLWFTFFHEAGHLLLHGKKDVFLEGTLDMDQKKEEEANRFAADMLIPAERWAGFEKTLPHTLASVQCFAAELGIAASIVVGRLQREKRVAFSWGNELKCRLTWQSNQQAFAG
ncbi:MAG: ImmA/IrrE family metallo-endopeptidase [Magnetococcales bacterium]|nr:ImmA/IrrE family metallo-endopeptidase [Magnetococcales bacterium]MBF0116343.1 ImmA/IrrE family metallo-endopeptidase [Magnetococcales bacterium]